MSGLTDLISAVPGAAWAALLTGATAVAVLVVQLWHDRLVRRREREFAVRREIYLEAVEAIAAVQSVLFNFGRLDLSQQELSASLQGYPGWLNKVHVVASDDTIRAFREMGDYFVTASFDLIKVRIEIDDLDSQIKNLEERREQLSRFQGYLFSIARGSTPQLPAGLGDPAAAIVATKSQLDTVLNNLEGLKDRRRQMNVQIVRLSTKHGASLPRVAVPVTVAIRREIGLSINEGEYRRGVEESSARIQGQLEELIAELDRKQDPRASKPG